MARGDCQRDFAEAAEEDGILLGPQTFPWICQRGHLGLPDEAAKARDVLGRIFHQLGGSEAELSVAPTTRLRGDFLHEATGTLIDVDEHQHFTTARLTTLSCYPDSVRFGFDVEHYRTLCQRWRREADRAFAHRAARGFGAGGRQRQRAYYDSLRDLAAPAMGHPPMIRIDAPLGNGRAAYFAHRDRLMRLLN